MHFGIDGGGGFGLGGIVLLMMVVAIAFSVIRYNNFTRPQEERELADEHEAERRAREAEQEDNTPL